MLKLLPFLARGLSFAAIIAAAATSTLANPAIVPAPRDANWVKRHEGFVAIARQGEVDVLFLGDSITDAWRRDQAGKKIWDEEFAPLKSANFGISGDRTQHVLWRIDNGELEGINPKVIVLMIGTNNTGFESDKVTARNTSAETAEGVSAIVRRIRTRLPQTKIMLLAIFPRGELPDHPQRLQVADINVRLKKLHDGKHVHFLDIGDKFLAPDGSLPKDIMPDALHPNTKGYEIWAAAMKEPLVALLR